MFLPGTYGTSLIRNHALAGVFEEMENLSFPSEVIEGIKKSVDCSLSFFGHEVSILAMYLIVIIATLLFIAVFVLISFFHKRKNA